MTVPSISIAVNGITREASIAIMQGKQPNFFVADGYDLTMLMEDNVQLLDFLRQRQRLLAEEGRVAVPFIELAFKTRDARGRPQ
jgi:hypothetical protein